MIDPSERVIHTPAAVGRRPTLSSVDDDLLAVIDSAFDAIWCAATDAALSRDFGGGDEETRARYRNNVLAEQRRRVLDHRGRPGPTIR